MEFVDHLSVLEVLLVILHEQLPCLLVQRTLGEGDDQEALDHLEYVVEGPGLGVPVLLQSVNADLPLLRYIGMEDFSQEVAWMKAWLPLGGLLGKSGSIVSLHL